MIFLSKFKLLTLKGVLLLNKYPIPINESTPEHRPSGLSNRRGVKGFFFHKKRNEYKRAFFTFFGLKKATIFGIYTKENLKSKKGVYFGFHILIHLEI